MPQTSDQNDSAIKKPFQLGALTIDPQTRRINKDSQSLTCEPKVFDLLLYFCAQDGEIITRDQLLADIWLGRVVSDNAINRKIYQLRKLLASLDSDNEYIETIPKFGYRLAYAIESETAQTPATLASQPAQTERRYWMWISLTLVMVALLIFMRPWQPAQSKPPELKQLTSLEGIESDASLSPDGRHLLFSFSKDGQSRQLILQDNETGKRQTLTDTTHHDIRAQWHPNGQKIAFVRISTNPDDRCSFYSMTLKPQLGEPHKLINCAYANLPSLTWGASTNTLFFAERSKKTQPYLVYSLDTSTGNKQQLTLPSPSSNLRGDYFVQRNLSGNKVTILHYITSNKVKVSIYNSEPFTLDHEFMLEAHINDIAWHPISNWFYFRRGQHIYKVDDKGESTQQVFHLGVPFGGLNFSADGKQLLMSSRVNDTDIWHKTISATPSATTETAAFIGSTKRDSRPRFANTSKTLAFISNRSGKNAFWLRTQAGQVSKLADLDFDVGLPNFIWSPDDSHLLFEYQDQIYALKITTGKLDIILDSSYQAYMATWSSDGKSLYYGSIKSGDWQLWSFNLADKSSKQLTFNGGYTGYDNPADGLFYFSKYHNNGLWRINADGSESEVLESFSLLNWLNWRIIDNHVYYAQLSGKNIGIYQFNLTNMTSVQILKQEKGMLHDYSVNHDASMITFTKHISQSGDVMALQLFDE